MPASLNKVFLIGNLTRDPELRYLSTGQAVATFSVAVNRSYTTQSGEKRDEATFVRVVTWEKRAEVCNEYLKKGSPVFVEGRLQSRTWEGQDGAKRSTIEVVASNVQFLGRAGGSRGESSQAEDISVEDGVPPSNEVLPENNNDNKVPF
jgi:single-strand DNA-binding protein